jgi:hypothetical protein
VNITFPQEIAVKMMTSGAGNESRRANNITTVSLSKTVEGVTIEEDPYGGQG